MRKELIKINDVYFYRCMTTGKLTKIGKYEPIVRYHDWLLRLQSENFLIIVNKNTGEYRNIYPDQFNGNVKGLYWVALLMERHKNYMED